MSVAADFLCLLIADDLTGACDAAAPFAARGRRTVISLTAEHAGQARPVDAEVLAITTESRRLSVGSLPAVYRGVAERLAGYAPAILFKKIDSTLRGHAGAEISLAAGAFGRECVIVTSAFPAMGRTVQGGTLRVAGDGFSPVPLIPYWRAQGLRDAVHARAGELARALQSGCRFISLDASSDEDLDAIAAAGLAAGRRILWAGSAGLATALARTRALGPPAALPARERSAVLFCIGSNHTATTEQKRQLLAARQVAAACADTASPGLAEETLRGGRHFLMDIPCASTPAERIRELIGRWTGPLVLSGGDTASLVCRALDARAIRLQGEIRPGIARGVMDGGLFDGAPVATKSGAFGRPDALIQILDELTCLK
ncbi:MAG TPA: four-carbon acid sugar kinase family protein [Bryobacteraceae bacterium]|nr:four-carbon acid sugar kinase family protein [Bryobacteraceae bacterium]